MSYESPLVEIWRPIPNFEEYQISNWGRLMLKTSFKERTKGSMKGPQSKKQKISGAKTGTICLRQEGKNYWFKIGQLVLLAFVGPPPSSKEYNARHLNDNPEQSWITNLAWGTYKDNHNDGVLNGKHSKKGTKEALRYGAPLKGKPRPEEVKRKISATKRAFPERQFIGKNHGPDGRFV